LVCQENNKAARTLEHNQTFFVMAIDECRSRYTLNDTIFAQGLTRAKAQAISSAVFHYRTRQEKMYQEGLKSHVCFPHYIYFAHISSLFGYRTALDLPAV